MHTDNSQQLFPLTYQLQTPDEKLKDGSAIFMMHGVGSNEQDLFGLASQLPKNTYIFSLRGPIQLGPTNFGWYQVDFSSGQPTYQYSQVEQSRKQIIDFIELAIKQYHLDPKKIVLLGFSQGTIMSYSVAIAKPELVAGIAAFSGRMLKEDQQALKDVSLKNVDIFMSHSQADRMLSFAYAQEAQNALNEKIQSLELYTHGYGHAIDPASLKPLNVWLNKVLE